MDIKDEERLKQIVTRCRELGLDIYDIATVLEKKDPDVFVGSLAYALVMATITTKTDLEIVIKTIRELHQITNKNTEKYAEKMKTLAKDLLDKMGDPNFSEELKAELPLGLDPVPKSKKDVGNN